MSLKNKIIDYLFKDYSMSEPAAASMFIRYPQGRGNVDIDVNTKSVWVFAGVRIIAEKIASIPYNFYVKDKIVANNETLKQTIFQNPYFTFFEMMSTLIASNELQGWSAVQIIKPYLKILDVTNLQIITDNNQIVYRYNDGQKETTIPNEEIVIFRNYSPIYRLTGISSLSAAMSAINMEYYSMDVTEENFQNGLYINGVLKTNNASNDKEAALIGKQFKEAYGRNSQRIPVLYNGYDLVKLSLTPADYDLLKYQNITKNIISTALGVPTFLLNDMEHANYANAREQEGIFTRYTILPKITRLEEAINTRLLPALGIKGITLKYEINSLPEMQEDSEKKARINQIKIISGVKTINEWREEDGLKPVKGGEIPYIQMNLVPLETLNEPTKEPIKEPKQPIPTEEITDDEKMASKLKELFETKTVAMVMTKEMKERLWKSAQIMQKPQSDTLKREMIKILKKLEDNSTEELSNHASELFNEYKSTDYQEKKAIDEQLIKNIRNLILSSLNKDTIERAIRRYLTAYAQQSGDNTVSQYGWNIVFSMTDPLVREFLLKRPNLLAESIYGTHTNQAYEIIKDIFDKAQEEGYTFEQIKQSIKDKLGDYWGAARDWKAEQIAKTEVGAVHNAASRFAAKQGNMRFHAWYWAGSADPREHHMAMDSNDWIPIDEPFNVGGVEILSPANSGLPEEDINCNCIELFSLIGGD